MKGRFVAGVALAASLLVPAVAEARFSFTVGDNVYADGQWFTVDEYQQYKKTHPEGAAKPAATAQPAAQQPAQPAATTGAGPSAATAATEPGRSTPAAAPSQNVAALPAAPPAASVSPAPAIRAASCKTSKAYSEFPSEDERFDCGPVGQLTRQEMLAQGWKIDFIEKLPAGAGQTTLSAYKLILSR